jgi:hypothetical protein
MLPNDVETAPTIIVTPRAAPRLTVYDFGYRDCGELTDLATIWLAYPGRDMMMEVWKHMQLCPLCLLNWQAREAWRKWKEVQDDKY